MASVTILSGIVNILQNSQTLYADVQNVIATVKAAEADGKITGAEVLEIMESVLKVLGDITMSALDIKTKIS
jgi:uncharacterized membrane protein YebE (DUF533 family)